MPVPGGFVPLVASEFIVSLTGYMVVRGGANSKRIERNAFRQEGSKSDFN